MTSKQRAYLMSLASKETPVVTIGKGTLTPEIIESAREAIEKRELIKVSVLQNCTDDPKTMGITMAERLHATLVQVIGKKIVLYKPAKKPIIELPK